MQLSISIDTVTLVKSGISTDCELLADFGIFNDYFAENHRIENITDIIYTKPRHQGKGYHRIRNGLYGNLCQYTLSEDLSVESGNCEGYARISLQGQAMSRLTLENKVELITTALHLGWRFTRLDLDLDLVFETHEAVSAYYLKYVKPYCDPDSALSIKHNKCVQNHDKIINNEYVVQNTVIGTRASLVRKTIYNKYLESNGNCNILRFEDNNKAQRADNIAKTIATTSIDVIPQLIAGYVLGSTEFRDCESNIAEFWQELQALAETVPMTVTRFTQEVSLIKMFDYLIRQVAPTLSFIHDLYGSRTFTSIIQSLICNGRERITHHKLIYLRQLQSLSPRRLGDVLPSQINRLVRRYVST